ncbi:MAG: ABC transporter permease [Halobacteriaceae archaeon]
MLPVAGRILRSLRGDRRTLALVVIVPAFVIYLLSEVFVRSEIVAPVVLAVVVFFLTYLLTAIGFLRERTAGTLERILVAPVSKTGLVFGYILGYGVLATVQSLILLVAAIEFLDVTFAHGIGLFILVELLGALTALGIGIVLSLFAENEFQAIQFIPVVITPQVILGGTFLPIEKLPIYLEWPARVMPVTYLIDAMRYVVLNHGTTQAFHKAMFALTVFALGAIVVAGVMVRRTG